MSDHDRAERAIRQELAQLDRELAAIPSDRFAERSPLLKRRHELAAELRALSSDPETLARWADRAAQKDTDEGPTPVLPSPTESGGTA